ncbi:MAG: hypothetical protein AAB511_03150 [Patescibacteria group bacterium]
MNSSLNPVNNSLSTDFYRFRRRSFVSFCIFSSVLLCMGLLAGVDEIAMATANSGLGITLLIPTVISVVGIEASFMLYLLFHCFWKIAEAKGA